MIIQHNISALTAHRQMLGHNKMIAKSVLRLSTGKKINSAADDPAGMHISEQMRGKVRALQKNIERLREDLCELTIRDGNFSTVQDALTRLRELSTMASDATLTKDQRKLLDIEYQELIDFINSYGGFSSNYYSRDSLHNGSGQIQISQSTLAGSPPLEALPYPSVGDLLANRALPNIPDIPLQNEPDGVMQRLSPKEMEEGINEFEQLLEEIDNTDKSIDRGALGRIDELMEKVAGSLPVVGTNLRTQESAQSALDAVGEASQIISRMRAALGAQINAINERINAMETELQNLIASESAITDVDMAAEMMHLVKSQIMAEASKAMLAQAMAQPKVLLSLLQTPA